MLLTLAEPEKRRLCKVNVAFVYKRAHISEKESEQKRSDVRAVNVDYYTDADLSTSMKVLDVFDEKPSGPMTRYRGEVMVSTITRMFKKMKLDTRENLGWGPVTLPELEMQTTACWWTIPESIEAAWPKDQLQDAMVGLCHLMRAIAPLNLMCAPSDIAVVYHVRDPFTQRPTLYFYDCVEGGLGLSDHVYETDRLLFQEALERLNECPCENGCPSCVGAAVGPNAKDALRALLQTLLDGGDAPRE